VIIKDSSSLGDSYATGFTVRSRINQNAVRKKKIMVWEMDVVPRTMSRIIKQTWGFQITNTTVPYRCIKRK
jgi:hypothetical protein